MIQNNILSDRLNAYRQGEPFPDSGSEDYENSLENNLSIITKMGVETVYLLSTFLRSVAYGFALKTILITDWKFIAILAIGYSIDLITNGIFNIFKN